MTILVVHFHRGSFDKVVVPTIVVGGGLTASPRNLIVKKGRLPGIAENNRQFLFVKDANSQPRYEEEVCSFFAICGYAVRAFRAVAAPAAKNGGTKGDRGYGSGATRKIFRTTPLFMLGNALLPKGNAYVCSRGNAVQMQLNVKEQRDCQDLGISDDQFCKQSYVCYVG